MNNTGDIFDVDKKEERDLDFQIMRLINDSLN